MDPSLHEQYLIHEHSQYTCAIDKYYVFTNKNEYIESCKKILKECSESLELDYYMELYEYNDPDISFDEFMKYIVNNYDGHNTYVCLTKGDYYVFTNMSNQNGRMYGRRP